MNGRAGAADEVPEHGRGDVTQCGSFPARKNGSHKGAVPADVSVSDRVDAFMKAMQPAVLDAVPDGCRPEAAFAQLTPRCYAVLFGGEVRHPGIGCQPRMHL